MKRICHLFSRQKKKDPFSTGRYIQKETHHPSLESIGAFSQVELLFFACFEWEDAKKLLASDATKPNQSVTAHQRPILSDPDWMTKEWDA